MFVGLHVLLAERTQTPEIAISDEEGRAMQVAAQNVLRHYSVAASQKTLDWIALWACVGGVYGPRVVAIAVRRQSETAAKKPPRGQVIRLHKTNGEPPKSPGPVAPGYPGSTLGGGSLPPDIERTLAEMEITPDTDGSEPAA
jgi:hypothetical protein